MYKSDKEIIKELKQASSDTWWSKQELSTELLFLAHTEIYDSSRYSINLVIKELLDYGDSIMAPKAKRQCENWLITLMDYVEETEAPRVFWLWSGLSTIASALQRKVWLPFGMETLYPNLYVMLVADPGECRKGAPLSFSKKILQEIGVHVFADSPTKRAFTKELDEIRKMSLFYVPNDPIPKVHSSMSVVSKEFSSLLAVNPKEMIEVLTDLWDSHDEWEYKTSDKGKDKLVRVCINAFIGTTPRWLTNNLPPEAIGGGFTSRVVFVYAREKYKWLALPPQPNDEVYQKLKGDLKNISQLVGAFKFGPHAEDLYVSWYSTIKDKSKDLSDDRLKGNLARLHAYVLKSAMALHVAYSPELLIEESDLSRAIKIVESSIANAGDALGGHGSSRTAAGVERIMRQIQLIERISFAALLKANYRETNKLELTEILETLEGMKVVKLQTDIDTFTGGKKILFIEWVDDPTKPVQISNDLSAIVECPAE